MLRSFLIFCILILPLESISSIFPPYNRGNGIDGCIKTKWPDEPQDWTGYLLNMCAEDSSANTYKTPKIRVRSRSCNAFSCWGKSTNLAADGECVVWPGPYAVPLTRICARIAMPSDPTTNTPQDDGYTPRQHLAYEGENVRTLENKALESIGDKTEANSTKVHAGTTVKDMSITGSDGVPFYMDNPKICAYHDPWMLEHVIPNPFFDPLDYNPLRQPMHTGSGVSPIAQLIINLVELGEDILLSPITITQTIASAAGAKDAVLESIMEFIPKVVKFVGRETIVALLTEFGQFNRAVYSRLGCTNLKLGYFPPPYCPNTATLPPSPTLTMICPDDVNPEGDKKCVKSSTTNNAINNSVRVSLGKSFIDISLPFPTIENTATTTKTLLSGLQQLAGKYFYAAITRTEGVGTSPPNDQLSSDICVYSTMRTNSGTNTWDPADKLVGCVPRAKPPKPTIYQCGAADNTLPACQISTTISDNVNPSATTSTNTSPLMIVRLQAGTDYTQGIVGTASMKNVTGVLTSLNLAGFNYSAYATDESHKKMPFSIKYPKQNPTTLYGEYIAGASGVNAPVDANGDKTDAIYLKGMEYVTEGGGGKYKIHGTQLCLTGYDNSDPCPSNPKNCVLTKLLNADITPCSTFLARISSATYSSGVPRCIGNTSACTVVETISAPDPSSTTLTYSSTPVRIMNCPKSTTPCLSQLSSTSSPQSCYSQYCYSHPSNKDLCQTSYAEADRIDPAPPPGCGNVLLSGTSGSKCAYYNNTTPTQNELRTTLRASPTTMECGLYITSLSNTPYGRNITQCSAANKACPRIEYFTSTAGNVTTTVNINQCTDPDTKNITYCYYNASPNAVSNNLCQLSTRSTERRQNNGTVTEQKTKCPTYLSMFSSKAYPGINQCLDYQKSCSRTEYLRPNGTTTNEAQVNINNYGTNDAARYCYYSGTNAPINSAVCNLSIRYPGIKECGDMQKYCSKVYDNQGDITLNCNNVLMQQQNTYNECTEARRGLKSYRESQCTLPENSTYNQCIRSTEHLISVNQYATGRYCYYSGAQTQTNTTLCELSATYPGITECIENEKSCSPVTGSPFSGNINVNKRFDDGHCYYIGTSYGQNNDLCSLSARYPRIRQCNDNEKYCTYLSSIGAINVNQYDTGKYCYYTGNKISPDGDMCPPQTKTPITPNDAAICDLPIGSTTRYDDSGNVIQPPSNTPTTTQNSSFNPNLHALRSKTGIEQNLCVPIPPLPTCAAITTPTPESGNATWPETKVGEEAIGVPSQEKRYCIIDPNNLSRKPWFYDSLNSATLALRDYTTAYITSESELGRLPDSGKSYLLSDDFLSPGQKLVSPENVFELRLSAKNLIIYNTIDKSAKIIFKLPDNDDVNFITRAEIRRNGVFVIYDKDDRILWKTQDSGRDPDNAIVYVDEVSGRMTIGLLRDFIIGFGGWRPRGLYDILKVDYKYKRQ